MKRETIKLQAPLTYYGGKRRLVSQILPLIPKHNVYCEPFFGGGTVFFEKKPSYLEVINDINDNLITFYNVCQNRYQELNTLIENSLYSESLFLWAKQVYNGLLHEDELKKAFAVFIVFNMSINSCPNNNWSFNNGTGGSHSGILYAHKRDSFCPWIKERLRYVQISCRDALKVIGERDTQDTFFYLDPPYPNSNQGHYSGFTEEMLQELLETLSTIRGKFMLSNYPAELITTYAQKNNWQLKEITMKSDIMNQAGQRRQRQEILLMNYQSKCPVELGIF